MVWRQKPQGYPADECSRRVLARCGGGVPDVAIGGKGGAVMKYWAIKWRQQNKRDGRVEYFMNRTDNPGRGPLLFPTRQEAREYIDEHWGYIKVRPDLRAAPHGWKMPIAICVTVHLKAVK
jgi:hypothetical protein